MAAHTFPWQAVEQKHPCVRGCTPSLFLFSLSLQSPLSSPLSSDLPANNRNPFIFHLSTFPLLSLSLRPPSLNYHTLSLSPASGLLFQSAQNTPVFVWSVSFIFLTLDGLQGRGGQERMGKRRRRRRRRLTGVAGQIPLLWGALGIRGMVRPLEPSWFIAEGCHGPWRWTDALGLTLATTSFTEHITFPALKASEQRR